jgi:hypothetical protein
MAFVTSEKMTVKVYNGIILVLIGNQEVILTLEKIPWHIIGKK